METLFGLFDTVACIGEVLSRSEDKDQELQKLSCTVESVSQSVRTFSASLPVQDRDRVFNSNQVFPQLAKVLQRCKQVILDSYQKNIQNIAIQDQNGQSDRTNSLFLKGMLKNSMRQGSRTIQEILEVASSKMGNLGPGLLRLPEDELALLRQANADIMILLPQLQLAISASLAACRQPGCGTKRKAEDCLDAPQKPAIASDVGVPHSFTNPGEEDPLLLLQLVTDVPGVQPTSMPALSTKDIRPMSASSTTSLESNEGRADGGTADEGRGCILDSAGCEHVKLVFGRHELRDRVPEALSLPPKKGAAPQPLSRFVSRDFMMLEVPQLPVPVQDSLDMATLALGCDTESAGPLELTYLARACGLTVQGGDGWGAMRRRRYREVTASRSSWSHRRVHRHHRHSATSKRMRRPAFLE
eukprot:TRINITY_DN9434_c0_g1_i3.p1 TRINITY_DN9434_c0_g1~~TRINITY_DN9434_c0_g1_i3.p1  ORF type:complete len:415 (-),score=69.58 TRINITY_DN9434_c0_g1_i3:220-1464(-)